MEETFLLILRRRDYTLSLKEGAPLASSSLPQIILLDFGFALARRVAGFYFLSCSTMRGEKFCAIALISLT